ncbi:MAG: hypothetical protein EOO60_04265 [Hymenobacter sp.]|nr:MAG: hypothetical protein EOO60_04265 [Hymenobacter sp.]
MPPLFSDETVLALALTAHSPWKVLNEHYQEDGSEEYMNRYERVRDYQERGDALYADYAAIVEGLLCCQYDGITSTSYNEGLKQVERTFLSYFQHPGLCTPGHIAHQRLADLQFVHVLLQSLQKQAAAIEAKTLYAPGVKPKRPLHYDFLSKRQLQHLWANLLGVP